MSRVTNLDRRAVLTAGAVLGTTALCGPAARALTPNAAYRTVEFIAVDFKAVAMEKKLYSSLPKTELVEQKLIDHIQQGVIRASYAITAVQRYQAPLHQPELGRVLFATVRTDLTQSPLDSAANKLVGVTSLFLYRRFEDENYAYVPAPMTIFGVLWNKPELEIALLDAAKRQLDANLITPVLQAN